MALDASKIVFVQSANMADVAEGGGPPSANELVSGRSNDIFPDISEETRTVGRCEIYSIHSMLRNADRAMLMGANCIIAQPPADPNVSVVMLSLRDPFATRLDIARRIESGMSAGSEFSGYLLENVQATMRNIRIFQRPGATPPATGKTLVLAINEGQPNERSTRVRVKSVETTTEWQSEVINGQLIDYEAQITVCELYDGLAYSFEGSPPSRLFGRKEGKAVIRTTVYSDSGMFYSAARLTAPVLPSDNWIQIPSPYVQLVPNTTTEVSSTDQRPASRSTLLLAESPRRVEVGVTPHTQRIQIGEENAGLNYVALLLPLPDVSTVTVDYFALGQRYTFTSDADGNLTGAGAGVVSALTGTLSLTLKALPDIGTQIVISWGSRIAYTNRSGQASFRAPEYAFAVAGDNPTDQIVRSTLSINYTSNNVVQTITDDGNGNLTGAATGTVDYPSRFLLIRPTLPVDSGSQFQITCTLDAVVTEVLTTPAIDSAGVAVLTLAQQPAAGTIKLDWVVARSVSSTSGGTLDTTTAIKSSTSYSTIEMQHVASYWDWDTPPPEVADPSINWVPRQQAGSTGGGAGNPTDVGILLDGYKPVTVWKTKDNGSSQSKLIERSGTTADNRIAVLKTLTDDGNGKFLGGLGTANYTGRQLMVQLLDMSKSTSSYQSDHEDPTRFNSSISGSTSTSSTASSKGGSYSTTSVGEEAMGAVQVSYRIGAGSPVVKTQTYTPPAVTIDLCPFTSDAVISGSVLFRWMGADYQDFEGVIYRDRTSTSAGTACGYIDYLAGIVTMYDYLVTGTNFADFQLLSLYTRKGQWTTASTFFNTDASPLRAGPGGFILSVVDTQGNVITANVDGQGNISGQHLLGKVEFGRGGVQLQFGDYVADDSLTAAQKAEWWYRAADVGAVQAGKIWRPWPVDPTTLRYSTVSKIYLPVDVSLMGIDPAALPADGRVTFVRPGDTCVLGKNIGMNSASFVPVIGTTYSVGAERLSFVQVLNADTGEEIKVGYTVDLDAGTVKFTDLTGYPAMVRLIGRVEVYRQIAEVRIDGRIKLTQPVGHGFEVGDVFSTALRQGDRFARVSRVYDQSEWSGVLWSNGLVGNAAVATYDTTNYQIIVTNKGAITERWALKFRTNGTTFDLIGQHLGQIASGTIFEDFSPINRATGAPYFTILAAGWGTGWVGGNTLFADTVGAEFPIALARCTQPSSPVGVDDSFWIVQRGDVDRAPATSF